MFKRAFVVVFLLVAVFFTATFVYWTKQPSYALSKIITAARSEDRNTIEKHIDVEGVASSLVEEILRLSQDKLPVVGMLDNKSGRAKDFVKKMAQNFINNALSNRTPGFKFKDLSFPLYFALQAKLYFGSFTQNVVARSDEAVDISYDLEPLFQQKYNAVFSYKKIGNEWVLFEVRQLIPH